jgi:hypothetical protein
MLTNARRGQSLPRSRFLAFDTEAKKTTGMQTPFLAMTAEF